jgi:hypothetical protein
MEEPAIEIQAPTPARLKQRFFWTSHTTVFRPAEPSRRQQELCGIIDARASLKRVRRGHRGQVRLWVKPSAIEAAVRQITEST